MAIMSIVVRLTAAIVIQAQSGGKNCVANYYQGSYIIQGVQSWEKLISEENIQGSQGQ